VYGAGAGGAGVAWAMRDGMIAEGLTLARGAPSASVRARLQGPARLESRAMEDYKRTLATSRSMRSRAGRSRRRARLDLLQTIENSGATILLGLSGQPGAFTEAHVRAIGEEQRSDP
jgi:malate dehydrogenase (oxaloacetate-decarboxylating)